MKSRWDDLCYSVLAEVVGMSYHQSWPRHQTWKRHHSLQVSTSPACHHHHRLFLLCITGKLLWPRLFLCHWSWQFLTSLQFMSFLCMESTLISQSSALPSDIDTNGSSRWDSLYTIHGKTIWILHRESRCQLNISTVFGPTGGGGEPLQKCVDPKEIPLL